MSRPDALVAGGGLAGAAAAIWLARGGCRVELLERATGPHHKVCGEFLSWETQAFLADCGVELEAEGAVSIHHVRLVAGARSVSAPLGFRGRSLSRFRLDEALLGRAAAAGVEVRRGVSVRALEPDGSLATSHGRMQAATTILATGKHGLRGAPREMKDTLSHQLGFKTYFRLGPGEREELADHVELILFEGGYAGLQLVERDMANLCLLVSPQRYRLAGSRFDGLLASLKAEVPHLARRLAGAVPLLDRPLAIANMPYGFRWDPGPTPPPARFPVGDQATVIPSFTGDGMGLALYGARLAATAILMGEGAGFYARLLAQDAHSAVARATAAQKLVGEAPARHRALARLASAFPGLLTLGARLTRLPPRAVSSAVAAPSRRTARYA
ncbi:MAG: FAD-dependent monooxygenase [Sphingomonadaceae bacterium]